MKNTLVSLEPSLVALIEMKATMECGDQALLYSSTYIKQLNDHISRLCRLSSAEIAAKINYLVGCLTITLDMPMSDLKFLRVRRCEGKRFEHIKELSYIECTTKNFPVQGRLNQSGQALFYAALAIKPDDTALRVVLSEAGANNLDHLNVINSHQKGDCDLYMRVIGLWDQARYGYQPYYLGNHIFDYYKKAIELMEQKFAPNLLLAYQLTDRFFADILSRKGSVALYQVTSVISSLFLEGSTCDGVLYSSVEAKGEPVVALKPLAVDSKLKHKWVCDIKVNQWFGYEFFKYKTLSKTVSIDGKSGNLVW
ncbi:MAG: hypothetical protein COA93_11665 [Alphaproteobacteria bacterium]|nr:MAG: hypothetical protein COA93_11665 [Alphaproteobacteria bacterium]